MLRLGSAPLAFLGNRSYLHSTDVFQFFCDATATLPPDDQPVLVESFKFLRETNRTGTAFVLDAGETLPPDQPKPVVGFTFRTRGQAIRRLLLTDDGPPIMDRRPDEPPRTQRPVLTGDFSGTVECHDIRSLPAFFSALIDAFRTIHEETLRRRGEDPNIPYRFVTCEMLPLTGIVPPDGRGVLTFELVDLRRGAGRVFTFASVRFAPGCRPPLRLGFAYSSPPK